MNFIARSRANTSRCISRHRIQIATLIGSPRVLLSVPSGVGLRADPVVGHDGEIGQPNQGVGA